MSTQASLAFEIGTEEIPAFDLVAATKQLETLVPASLEDSRVSFDECTIFSTPRRLIVLVKGVAHETTALTEESKGPSVKIAFDDEGNPTKAAIGFARGKGLTVEDLERRTHGEEEYVYAVKQVPAQAVKDILPSVLENVIQDIAWPKSMRWGSGSAYFSRPVRWLLALLDDEVIPLHFAGLESNNLTWGHRFMAPGTHLVDHADELLKVLAKVFVVPNQHDRERIILEGVTAIEAQTHSRAELPAKTLTEVINLTEFPTPLVGTFDEEYLQVPEEIIIDAMLMHQRYFPLYDDKGRLTNRFIAVSNGDPAYSETIINGNERVIRPRLADAKFFYEEDLKHPLEYYVDHLDQVVFQESLGTMKAKTKRIVAVADHLAADAHLSENDARDTHRAAYLSKADLVSNAVVEFTSVQGIMGSYYAEASGETPAVAQAIAEHYRPRFAQDDAPGTVVGKIVAFSDKLDTICGLFAVGQAPTGSSDPFALRRSAIGIISMLAEGLNVSLVPALEASLNTFTDIDFDFEKTKAEIIEFFITRTKVMLRENGQSADVVDAVLASGVQEPAEIIARTEALSKARQGMAEVMDDLATAYARAHNLTDPALGDVVDEQLMGDAERALVDALDKVEKEVSSSLTNNEYAQALRALGELRQPIDRFFEDVLIMDDDLSIRQNRLRILNRFVSVFAHVADFGKMAKSGKQ